MIDGAVAARLVEFFLIGAATPLTAVCVIPLYPSFLAFLAGGSADDGAGTRRSVAFLGLTVVAGVLSFLALVGIVVTMLLRSSVTTVVEAFSPIAFGLLAAVGFVLAVAPRAFARLPVAEPPQTTHPVASAYGYGFFFGIVVLPCNPGLIALFFARVPVLFDSTAHSMLGFLAFGIGMGAPLLLFALAAEPFSRRVTRTLAAHSGPINRATGFVLLAVAGYYLTVVFAIVPLP